MKPIHWPALAAAFTGCAIALGIHIFQRAEPPPVTTARNVCNRTSPARHGEPAARNFVAAPRTRSAARRELSSAEPRIHPLKVGGVPPAGTHPVLTEAQWREQAARVEMEAGHELNRLKDLLDLDPSQQGKVFSALVRQSPNWLPGMKTRDDARTEAPAPLDRSLASANETRHSGPGRTRDNAAPQTLATPVEPDVTASLTPDQEQTLIQEELDRQAWWAEVIPQLLPPTLPEVAAGAPVIEEPVEDTKTFDGGDVLLEE